MRRADVLDKIMQELSKAQREYKRMGTVHEGVALIQEEVFELWGAIHKDQFNTDKHRKEAIQVATMAVRFLIDLC